jgi:hypothetical protein
MLAASGEAAKKIDVGKRGKVEGLSNTIFLKIHATNSSFELLEREFVA